MGVKDFTVFQSRTLLRTAAQILCISDGCQVLFSAGFVLWACQAVGIVTGIWRFSRRGDPPNGVFFRRAAVPAGRSVTAPARRSPEYLRPAGCGELAWERPGAALAGLPSVLRTAGLSAFGTAGRLSWPLAFRPAPAAAAKTRAPRPPGPTRARAGCAG